MITPNFEQNPPLILIVDDETTLRLLLRRAVEQEGYRTIEAANGKQCLELCQQFKPDLLLLDAVMPEMDGFTCCAQVSALFGNESPAILMTTGLHDKESVDRAFGVGASDYITKPIDWHVLRQRVRRLLQTRWAMTQLLEHIRVQDDLALKLSKQTTELVTANTTLQTEIAERQKVEEKIKASLHEKEVLLKEIHHRVKNNLQIISSLLKLQSRSVKDPQITAIFNESQSRIRTMALIHESLYQSNDLSQINFADYINQLAANLFRSYEIHSTIKSVINVDNVFLEIDVAVPCGLIVNELVSNSLKYAFPDERKGEIRISAYAEEEQRLILIVSDNGVGLPKNLDFNKTKTLGLQLVNNLVDQLEGSIEIFSDSGTQFRITFTL